MKETELQELSSLMWSGASRKNRFRSLSGKFLRELRDRLNIEATVRFNPGGPAVSGDAILHGDSIYVLMNADGMGPGIVYRRCNGRQDYTGGTNHWYPFTQLEFGGCEGLAKACRELMEEKYLQA